MTRSYDVSARTSADAATVYGLLTMGASWPLWSPIDAFELEQPADTRDPALQDGPQVVGDVRLFRTGRNVSRERVVALVPDRELHYELLSGGYGLLRDYRGSVVLAPDALTGTTIRWRATYTVPVPLVGGPFARYLGSFQQRMVDGLAAHAARAPLD